jgi:hypothetical protein
MKVRTIAGPGDLTLVLDSREIYPDDPGQGTPAMVHCQGYDATYWCALDTGELDCGAFQLTGTQQMWLQGQEDTVAEFMEENTPA